MDGAHNASINKSNTRVCKEYTCVELFHHVCMFYAV